MSADSKKLKEAFAFFAELTVAYTNSLYSDARRPFADAAGHHMEAIVLATQAEPPKGGEKK